MFDHLSEDQLTNDILKALIRRTQSTLAMLNLDTNEFDGKNFSWNMDNSQPTLRIDLGTRVIFLWWNKKFEESEMEVFSNIYTTANQSLAFFITLETIVYNELAELQKDIPLRKINLSDFEEDEFELGNIEAQGDADVA